jgi:hypothetical protein
MSYDWLVWSLGVCIVCISGCLGWGFVGLVCIDEL